MFTPTQQKLLAVLSDGLPHTRRELHGCLHDELGPETNIHMHLTNIRKVLRPRGQDIVCVHNGRGLSYRHVRMLHSSYDGG